MTEFIVESAELLLLVALDVATVRDSFAGRATGFECLETAAFVERGVATAGQNHGIIGERSICLRSFLEQTPTSATDRIC